VSEPADTRKRRVTVQCAACGAVFPRPHLDTCEDKTQWIIEDVPAEPSSSASGGSNG